MNTKEKIEIMQAFEDGAEIESSPRMLEKWTERKSPEWDWGICKYRIKKKPRTVTLYYYRKIEGLTDGRVGIYWQKMREPEWELIKTENIGIPQGGDD